MAATEPPISSKAQNLESFVHDQLDSSTLSIRLLELLPDPEGTDDPQNPSGVCCNIAPRTFDSKPKYDALSYTWGTKDLTRTIKLNSRFFRVSENLYSALCSLRKKRIRVIWIDAICINQNNTTERNGQVSVMDFIYSRAQRVIVWLSIDPLHSTSTSKFDKVSNLHNHPYWSRLWILQEIGLAHDLKVCFDGEMYNWDDFVKFFSVSLNSKIGKVFELRRNRYELHRLELLVENFQDAKCAEPRDKIFGFLGLADDPWSHVLTVDYEISMFDLYASVIEIHQTTLPLNDLNGISRSVDRSARLIKFSQLIQRILGPKVDNDAGIRALPENPRMFEVRGFVVGEIQCLGPTYSDVVCSPKKLKEWKQCFHTHYNKASELKLLKESYDHCYWSSLEWKKSDEKVRNVGRVSFGFRWNAEESTASAKSSKDGPVAASALGTDPRLFLGTNTLVGFVPPQAQEGDTICHFWGCDVTIVLRRQGDQDYYQIVGSAHVSMVGRPANPINIINLDLSGWKNYQEAAENHDFCHMMRLKLDIETLQKLTC